MRANAPVKNTPYQWIEPGVALVAKDISDKWLFFLLSSRLAALQ